jgi:hypothetical protein
MKSFFDLILKSRSTVSYFLQIADFIFTFLCSHFCLWERRRVSETDSPDFLPEIAGKEMDVVEMVLMERATGIPLDLIILIRSFLYEKLTDDNFFAAVELWFGDEEKCRLKFGHISDWNTSRVTKMANAFFGRKRFDEDLSRWNVSNVTDMCGMFME